MNKFITHVFLLFVSFNTCALNSQQKLFKQIYSKALNGDTVAVKNSQKKLKGYRLNHYLDYALIRSKMAKLPIKEIEQYSKKHKNSPLNTVLDKLLIYELGKQKKWNPYLKRYKNNKESLTKHCWYLQARIETKQLKGLSQAIKDTWMNGLSLPTACNSVFKWWTDQGNLTDSLILERINLNYKVNNASTARYLKAKLKKTPAWIDHALLLMDNPLTALKKSTQWPDNDITRKLVSIKAKAVAKKHPNDMYGIWPKLKKHFSFSSEQIDTVDRTIALFAATDYLPFTIKAMDALPDKQHDAQIYAWKTRYHLFNENWPKVLETVTKMPAFQLNKDNWQYWLARASAKTGNAKKAQSIFVNLAQKSNYYGFLSADHMRLPYEICSEDIAAEPIVTMPNHIENAFELFSLNMIKEARKEWIIGYRKLSTGQRRALADIAYQKGWYNKVSAIMGALGLQKNYKLRYPLAYLTEITKYSKKYNQLPQWIMSIITQESAWQTDAISSADARGLMQIIEPTAKRLSKKMGISYNGKWQLHQANYNLHMGIFYQSILFNQFGNHPLLALASYNAGERKAEDWLNNFPAAPDIWTETIPYIETRGYITKILTNMTIYDWLINKNPKRIASWMPTFPINGNTSNKWPNDKISQEKANVVCRQ